MGQEGGVGEEAERRSLHCRTISVFTIRVRIRWRGRRMSLPLPRTTTPHTMAQGRPSLPGPPMYVFDLPPGLASSLVLRTAEGEQEDRPTSTDPAAPADTAPAKPTQGAPPCTLCPGCEPFASVRAQRSHFQSLWHRYNLVLKQYGARDTASTAALVTRDMLDEQLASLHTGSDDESDDGATQDDLSALVGRLTLTTPADEGEAHAARSVAALPDALRSPLLWYETRPGSPMHVEQTQLGLYRDVLLASSGETQPSSFLASLTTPRITIRPGTQGWSGKHLQGTHQVGRAMQMHVLDGQGLVPWLHPSDLAGVSSSDVSDTSSGDDDDEATLSENSAASDAESLPASIPLPPLRLWTFVMMGGGHFAIATMALNLHVPPLSARAEARGAKAPRSIVVLAHKTFHRYTTRRKQGGSQSAQDAAGKHAKSAGANLRRYGEQQLRTDIHTLLQRRGWRTLIERSEHVWVRTSMRAANGVLWHWTGHETSPLDAKQAQGTLSHIPIATQRPTLSEIVRCFLELTRVKVAHLTPEELAAQDDAAHQASVTAALRANAAKHTPTPPPPRPKKMQKDVQEQRERERWIRMISMVRKGKIGPLEHFLERHASLLSSVNSKPAAYADATGIDTPLPAWWRQAEAKSTGQVPTTLLQAAAAADQADMVQYLLTERHADPTLPVLKDEGSTAHRTAYDLCNAKATRAVFRRVMAEQPTWWKWDEMGPGGARVPSALTADMEEAQASKARSRRAAMREKLRERDAKLEEKAQAEAAAAAAAATSASTPASTTHGPRRLGDQGMATMSEAGLSDEMRRRIEREKRARAAEARMLRK